MSSLFFNQQTGKLSMSYADKQITCADCGAEFTFTSGEQERYAQLGFTNEPKRCSSCRAARKATRGNEGGEGRRSAAPRFGSSGGPREMFPAVCAECGKPTQVPFKPRGDRPVYCSDCFSNRR
jgi:CxxC-x17-CxxC domain-containing protein